MKVALIYDRVNKLGGAERVLADLKKIYTDAPIYTLVSSERATWAKRMEVISSPINKLSFFQNRHELLTLLAPMFFEQFDLSSYDLVISVTSDSAKAVITSPNTFHLCYCLTPARYLWPITKSYQKYPNFGIFSPFVKVFLKLFKDKLQKRDYLLSKRPDAYISISKTVQRRVSKYYQVDSEIVYPGIDFSFWSQLGKIPKQKFYLVVSRLVPYKKVDLIVEAFNKNQLPLVVVGDGSDLGRLQKLARSNIRFHQKVSDADLRLLYAQAQALVFAGYEDFGLVPLEAQATGTPVIGYARGGVGETVVNKKTGLLFKKQSVVSLNQAIEVFKKTKRDWFNDCQSQAKKYDTARFVTEFSAKVNSLLRASNY